jgi:hypothetical protein
MATILSFLHTYCLDSRRCTSRLVPASPCSSRVHDDMPEIQHAGSGHARVSKSGSSQDRIPFFFGSFSAQRHRRRGGRRSHSYRLKGGRSGPRKIYTTNKRRDDTSYSPQLNAHVHIKSRHFPPHKSRRGYLCGRSGCKQFGPSHRLILRLRPYFNHSCFCVMSRIKPSTS